MRRTFQVEGEACAKALGHEGVWLREVKKPEACCKSWGRGQPMEGEAREEAEWAGPGGLEEPA